ncbi:MAG: hypothetical protein ACKVQS_02570 [Fimbriimonadaceae bacterium]
MASKTLIAGISSILFFAFSALTPSKGEPQPNFAEDIAPIIKKKCLPCHQAGGIGPFDFTTYRNFNRHMDLIRIQVLSRSMPPTRATSDFGPLATTPPLTDEEIVIFQKYENAKLPEGQPLITPISRDLGPAQFKPTLVLKSPKSEPVRAEGTAYWRAHSFPISESINLSGLTIIPIRPGILRSAQFAVLPPGFKPPAQNTEPSVFLELPGLINLGTWAPGFPDWQLPSNTTKTIPKGSHLIVVTKVQPAGRPEDGDFKLGLLTKNAPAPNELEIVTFTKTDFTIKANESPTFTIGKKLTQSAELIGLIPQARFYCGQIESELQIDKSNIQNLLKVPKWDPYWIGSYLYPTPVHLPSGADLIFKFAFFNDDKCEINENKSPEDVSSGPRLKDEVCRMHILISRPRD